MQRSWCIYAHLPPGKTPLATQRSEISRPAPEVPETTFRAQLLIGEVRRGDVPYRPSKRPSLEQRAGMICEVSGLKTVIRPQGCIEPFHFRSNVSNDCKPRYSHNCPQAGHVKG